MYENMKPEKRNMLIERILRAEWEMFRKVDNIGGRAGCQDDWPTFHIMRYSFYDAWPDQLIVSYMKDLEEATRMNRNIITEKYAYMMEFTDPAYYSSNLMPYLPGIEEETRAIIGEITDYMVACEKELALRYPKISRRGRPIETGKETGGETSAETYAKGELRTYSRATLGLYADYVRKCKADGTNLAFLVKDKMVKMYGYASLDDAESKM